MGAKEISDIDAALNSGAGTIAFQLSYSKREAGAQQVVKATFQRTISSMSPKEKVLARILKYLEAEGIYTPNSKISAVLAWGHAQADILNWEYWFEYGNSSVHDAKSAISWVLGRYGITYDAEISRFESTILKLSQKYPSSLAVQKSTERLQAFYSSERAPQKLFNDFSLDTQLKAGEIAIHNAAKTTEDAKKAEVFISYSRRERHLVEPIKSKLVSLGVEVFFDIQGIDGGATFPDVIDQALRTSKAVLCAWSPNYFTRPWCLIECRNAKLRQTLIPVVITPIETLDAPADLQGVSYYNLHDWDGRTTHEDWRRTLNRISTLIGRNI